MRIRILVVLATAMFAQSSASSDIVADCKISCTSQAKKGSAIKVTEKLTQKIETISELSSENLNKGHTIFYQPQIIIGSDVKASYISSDINDDTKKQIVTHTKLIDCTKNETRRTEITDTLTVIPEAPILPPLIMPPLPTPVIVEEPVVILQPKPPVPVKEVIFQHNTVIIPQAPVVVSKPVAIPSCITGNSYLISVPCPPTVAVTSEVIEKITVKKPLLLPQPSPILNLRVPKISLGVVYNKPVQTVMPYSQGFISTTRFLPSVKVSRIPLQEFRQQNLLITPSQQVVVNKISDGFSSLSAYCAHNIALQRIVPNIIIGK